MESLEGDGGSCLNRRQLDAVQSRTLPWGFSLQRGKLFFFWGGAEISFMDVELMYSAVLISAVHYVIQLYRLIFFLYSFP